MCECVCMHVCSKMSKQMRTSAYILSKCIRCRLCLKVNQILPLVVVALDATKHTHNVRRIQRKASILFYRIHSFRIVCIRRAYRWDSMLYFYFLCCGIETHINKNTALNNTMEVEHKGVVHKSV